MVRVKEKKTGQRRYLLQRAKKFLSLKVRTLFYNSLIQPILDTGQLTNKRHEQDVIRLQKCAGGILDEILDIPTRPLFTKRITLPFNKGLECLQSIYIRVTFIM